MIENKLNKDLSLPASEIIRQGVWLSKILREKHSVEPEEITGIKLLEIINEDSEQVPKDVVCAMRYYLEEQQSVPIHRWYDLHNPYYEQVQHSCDGITITTEVKNLEARDGNIFGYLWVDHPDLGSIKIWLSKEDGHFCVGVSEDDEFESPAETIIMKRETIFVKK